MSSDPHVIGFVRRGYSSSGGAEAYLSRLADGLVRLGHTLVLFTTEDWPAENWTFGRVVRIKGRSVAGFADELQTARQKVPVDVLFSLERVCSCDIYRAGDGVHRAWLESRAKFETPWRRLTRKFNSKNG